MNTTRRGFLGGTAALAGASWTGASGHAQAQELVVNTYGARWERFWRETLLPGFERQTSIRARLDVGLGRTWMANMRAAGVNAPPYSVMMFNEVFANLMRGEGYFDPIPIARVPNLAKIHPLARNPDDNGVFGMISPIGLGYRSDLVRNAPRSWKDLWDNPEFRGKTGMYQIGNSAGVMFLLLTSRLYGSGPMDFDVGFRKIAELLPFQQVDFSGSMSTLLSRGEIVIAPLDVGEIVALRARGIQVAWVAPQEGMFMFEQSFNLLKNGPARDQAYRYLDYVLSTPVQLQLAREFLVTPTNTEVVIPDDLKASVPVGPGDIDKIIKWDWTAVNAQRDAMVDRWNRTIR
jgi:putative spermidine/putrescine transport system substrate-binding protein